MPGIESKVVEIASVNVIRIKIKYFLPKNNINFLLNKNCIEKNQIKSITEEACDGSEKKKVNLPNEVLPVNNIWGKRLGK